jgi:hypothetical protein
VSPPGEAGARSPAANPWQRTVVTSGYHSRFHFPRRRMRVEFTLEVPLEGDVVLADWIVTKSEVCDGEPVIDGQRIYFDVWVEPKPK